MSKTRIVVLTGAGISQESGIQTFRASDGLWENHPIEEVATPQGFERDPDKVYQFYNQRIARLEDDNVKPNAAHKALVDLHNAKNVELTLVTQNVDDLHERAGSPHVIHMHGSLREARCSVSGNVVAAVEAYAVDQGCQCCQPSNRLRPNIVWFGEVPFFMEIIENALFDAELFIAIGTSGNVYPAAGFVELAHQFGAKTVELNLEPTGNHAQFDEGHYGRASEVVPSYINAFLNR